MPPYLAPGDRQWTADYPEAFRAALPPLAGYTFSPGGDGRAARATSPSGAPPLRRPRRRPARGLVVAERDPLGRDTTIDHDHFGLLPVRSTDAAGLTTEADVRLPRAAAAAGTTDANGNRTAFAYTPLGMLERIAVMGKDGEGVGDTRRRPGYHVRLRPARGRRRTRAVGADHPPRPSRQRHVTCRRRSRDDTIETVEFSDGFGRLVQTRTQAEDVIFGDATFGGGTRARRARRPGDRP